MPVVIIGKDPTEDFERRYKAWMSTMAEQIAALPNEEREAALCACTPPDAVNDEMRRLLRFVVAVHVSTNSQVEMARES